MLEKTDLRFTESNGLFLPEPAELQVPQIEDIPPARFEALMHMHHGRSGERYKRSPETLDVIEHAHIRTLSGESGSGKSTLQKAVNSEFNIHQALSLTTRDPRMENGEMEEDGVHYEFLMRREALRESLFGELVQYKIVHGNVYGSRAASYEPGINSIDVVPETAQEMRKLPFLSVINIAVILPSPEVSTQRILGRGELPAAELKKRQNQSIESHQQLLDDADNFVWILNDDREVAEEDYRYTLTYGELPAERQLQAIKSARLILRHHLADRVS